MNRYFSKEDLNTGNKHMKKCSTSLIVTEMQIKTTMRYHLTPVRMATIKTSRNNRCWQGCREQEVFKHCWWECKLVQSLWKAVWQFLRDPKAELPFNPQSYYLLYTQKNINCSTIKTRTRMFIAAIPAIAKTWNQPKCPLTVDSIKICL